MLDKLFKHEMKATCRLLLPIYLVLAVFTIINRIVLYLDIFEGALAVIPGLLVFAYVVAIIAVFVVSFVIIIYRFYKNLLTDEGYLMFTLPVKTHEIINSKLLVSIIWSVVGSVAVIASIFVVFSGSEAFHELPDFWRDFTFTFKESFGSSLTILIIEVIAMIIISIINGILMIYVSIALGQFFSGHKVLGSFVSYIGISTVVQIISTVMTLLLGYVYKKSFLEINSIPEILFPYTLTFLAILTVVYYWLTHFIFKRKLNLD